MTTPNRTPNHKAPPGRTECLSCETMLTDALDGLLSPAEQRLFELHLQSCPGCREQYGNALEGAAWLEMLKSSRPQPRPELLGNILAATSGAAPLTPALVPAMAQPAAAMQPAGFFVRFGQVLLEPRLMMTAAMTFCSLALTLSLTGVRIDQLHASDLGPSGMRRAFYTAEAGAVRYYDNLRVVHVLESRTDDLRESPAVNQPEPAPEPAPNTESQPEPKHADPAGGGSSRIHAEPAAEPGLRPLLADVTLPTLQGEPR